MSTLRDPVNWVFVAVAFAVAVTIILLVTGS